MNKVPPQNLFDMIYCTSKSQILKLQYVNLLSFQKIHKEKKERKKQTKRNIKEREKNDVKKIVQNSLLCCYIGLILRGLVNLLILRVLFAVSQIGWPIKYRSSSKMKDVLRSFDVNNKNVMKTLFWNPN